MLKYGFNRLLLYRAWKYWQLGYTLYLTKPLAILQFITVVYVLLLERIPILQAFLPLTYFALLTFLIILPTGVALGWFYMRKSKMFGTETILATISNPIAVYSNRVYMEATLALFKKLKIKCPEEYQNLYRFWKKQEERNQWKPI